MQQGLKGLCDAIKQARIKMHETKKRFEQERMNGIASIETANQMSEALEEHYEKLLIKYYECIHSLR